MDAVAPVHSGEGQRENQFSFFFSANVFKMLLELYAAAIKRSSLCVHTLLSLPARVCTCAPA